MENSNRFEMTILKKDRAIVYEVLFGDSNYYQCDEMDNHDGTTVFIKDGTNYGNYEYVLEDKDNLMLGSGVSLENHGYLWQREKLAWSGIFFHGLHTWAYGERVFACYEGNHLEVNTMAGTPAVLVGRNGDVDNIALEKVREYYQTIDLVEKHFEAKDINANS